MNTQHDLVELSSDPTFTVEVTYAGARYEAFIGDAIQKYRARKETPSFERAVRWLQDQARLLYPNSRYAQKLRTT